jgi:hypothetical protein
MTNRWLAAGAMALGVLAMPVLAHHSFAMFDQTKEVTLKGKVVDFQWTNPHAFIHIEVPASEGAELAGVWEIELNSPNNLKRQGWASTSLKPGDEVTLMTNPLRDTNLKGGLFINVTKADGTVLGEATRAGRGAVNVPVVPAQ